MFLVCTLTAQKAEGKEKKRSLKMPCFLRCDICFCCARGWQEALHGGCSPGRKQVWEPERAALPPLRWSRSHPVAPPHSWAPLSSRLPAGDGINTCGCALKSSCWVVEMGAPTEGLVLSHVMSMVVCPRAAGGPENPRTEINPPSGQAKTPTFLCCRQKTVGEWFSG